MRTLSMIVTWGLLLAIAAPAQDRTAPDKSPPEIDKITPRPPVNDDELKYWLWNAAVMHRFRPAEVSAVLGLNEQDQAAAASRLGIDRSQVVPLPQDRLTILPYPGGRHPRIGFRDGAIDPQRETKVSVFTPWQPEDRHRADYVVIDVPEAIWSNLGLTYLAHTHIPTIWDQSGSILAQQEWSRNRDGVLKIERKLPNGIAFQATVVPGTRHVAMELQLHNGTTQKLSDLRVQNCVMLREADDFNQQTAENKLMQAPYACCRDASGKRWIITAWTPNHRTWGNPPCPCLHSDPKFPDCDPGQTQILRGWLSFYEGTDIQGELQRIASLHWEQEALTSK